jgi:conflict system STAND superfamily ATPase
VSEAAFATTPYKGLMPYSEEDAPFFFGRDAEREIIIANLMASRLTLFYGPSGVGKSSVLRAGVAHHLRRLARENLDETGSPGFAVVVFNSWRDDPVAGLEARVRDSALQSLNGQTVEPVPVSRSLSETFKLWTQRLGGELLVILDQFEEYFLYHGQEDGPESFAIQLPRIVNSPELNVNFLISIRDDGLAKLDRFQGRIPTLFDNRFGIDHLDRNAARDAITQPIEQFNRLYAAGRQRVIIEPELVEAVLDQVKTGQVMVGEAGRGVIKREAGKAQIETPYLQLVMNRLWDEEVRAGSRALRLKTLETLGGARRIVRTHLDAAMKALTRHEQDVAAHVFHYLVTPSGAKIAHTIPDLASYSELSKKELLPVMERLSAADIRILRGVAPPPDKSDEPRYEIFHDVLAAAILDWRQRYKERKRQVRFRVGVAALSVLMISALIFLTFSKINENKLSQAASTTKAELETANDLGQLSQEALAHADDLQYQKPLALLVNLVKGTVDEKSQAIDGLKQLANDGELPADLAPTVYATLEKNAPTKARETQQVILEALKSRVTVVPINEDEKPIRVFIHISDYDQRDKAVRAKKGLEERKVIVPGIEKVSNAPQTNELRFFRKNDAGSGAEVIGYLKDLNLGPVSGKYVPGYENSKIIQPHQYELWFGAPKKEPSEVKPQVEQNQSGDETSSALHIEVFDGETRFPVAGAVVSVSAQGKRLEFVTTNVKGVATVKDVPSGRILIQVKAKGFAAAAQESKFDPQSAYSQAPEARIRIALKRQPTAR